jgi:glutamate-ammonia-ligase adenylyltransferase
MKDLARILGASDFLWEDFVRNQYEALLPILQPATAGSRFSFARADLESRLQTALKDANGFGERVRAVNAWKDREIFLIDMDHILHARAEARSLAEPLTRLAEVVVQWAVAEAQEHLAQRHGVPRTVGRLRAPMAVFGLGKFGGEALGYASDIELLFVYGDNGATDGPEPIGNAEFFSRLVEETVRAIAAKQAGIFRVDIRLRPHGRSGPKACSLESFCRYYEPGGPALSYERLALTRLRLVAGDADLGGQVERLRDEFVYHPRAIDTFELQDLRERQLHEKAGDSTRYNAKFSPGGLVDLEYCVQMLQVLHGKDHPELRTPRIHLALAALSRAGVMEPRESEQLTDAYYFLRRLVNGLRMLRGNALDLFLPEERSDEYVHLARRMGYEPDARLSPEQQLLVDFETRTAAIRAFIAKYFGRERLPDPDHGNIADLLLSENTSEALRRDVLAGIGVRQTDRAYANLRRLAERDADRPRFSRLAVLVADALKRSPDADMALNNWERFAGVLPDPAAHYGLLLDQPKRIEILLAILAGSQFLADALVRNPEFFDWVTDPAVLHGRRGRDVLATDFDAFAAGARTQDEWLNAVRRFHRRETLRIGTRDIGLHAPTEDVLADLSALADALVGRCLARVWDRLAERVRPEALDALKSSFCVLALGKLGGEELNYSSDIDLLGVHDDGPAVDAVPDADALYHKAMDGLRHALSYHTEEGYAYRVDLRLRPHGRSGRLTPSLASVTEYYATRAALWEVQALLKARPLAGSPHVGRRFLDGIRPIVATRRDRAVVASDIRAMRERAVQTHGGVPHRDVKTGPGGIRDVEFLVQGLQLAHAADSPHVLTGNTLDGLSRLSAAGLLPAEMATRLREHYVFLRRVEHCLQVLENRQVHEIPESQESLAALARRVLGPEAAVDGFLRELRRVRDDVRDAYATYLA